MQLLGARFYWLAYLALAAGLWLPGSYAALAPATAWCLGGILFFTALKMPLAAFRKGGEGEGIGSCSGEICGKSSDARAHAAADSRPPDHRIRSGILLLLRRAALLSLVKLLVLPGLAYAVTLPIAPDYAPGVLLVAAMPAGMSTLALTDLYRGDRVLALAFILVSCLGCVLSVPVLLAAIGHGNLAFAPLAKRAGFLLLVLATPLLLAEATRTCLPRLIAAGQAHWGKAAIAFLIALIFVSVASHRDAWADVPDSALLLPLALAGLACGIGIGAGLLSLRLLPVPAATAFGLGAIYMNNGLGVAVAAQFFPEDPAMILPSVLMQVPMLAGAALFGRWCARRSVLDKGAGAVAPHPS